jgi:hypothetical protein
MVRRSEPGAVKPLAAGQRADRPAGAAGEEANADDGRTAWVAGPGPGGLPTVCPSPRAHRAVGSQRWAARGLSVPGLSVAVRRRARVFATGVARDRVDRLIAPGFEPCAVASRTQDALLRSQVPFPLSCGGAGLEPWSPGAAFRCRGRRGRASPLATHERVAARSCRRSFGHPPGIRTGWFAGGPLSPRRGPPERAPVASGR